MRMSGRDRIVLFTPLAILLTGWLVLPALLGLLATFTNYSPFTATVRFAGLANYATILSDPQFGAAARNIAVFTVVAVPVELVIGFGIAYLRAARSGGGRCGGCPCLCRCRSAPSQAAS